MASHMHETGAIPEEVHLLYTTTVRSSYNVEHVSALGRLLKISDECAGKFHIHLFFGGHPSRMLMEGAVPRQRFEPRMLIDDDVQDVFVNRELDLSTACYICGPSQAAVHLVELVRDRVGLESGRIFFEMLDQDTGIGICDPTRTVFR